MNIQLDYPEVWSARNAILLKLSPECEATAEDFDSLIDACFRQFASQELRTDMASSNYSRSRALLSNATHRMSEDEMNEPVNSIVLAIGHALLAQIEEFKS